MSLILVKRYTIAQLIKYHKSKIVKLKKRIKKVAREIEREEARIEKTLYTRYNRLAEECASYYIGLDRLMIEKGRERVVGK